MKNIGFLCSTSTQVQTFIPVMKTMKEDCHKFFWICLDKYYQWDAGKALNHAQIDYELFGKYDGRRFIDLSLPEMYWVIQDNIAHQISDFLSRCSLDILVVGNDRSLIEKQFIHLAKSRGIKTFLIQDGILWTSEVRSWRKNSRIDHSFEGYARDLVKESLNRILSIVGLSRLAPTYIGQGDCDAIAVMGQSTGRVLAQRGVDVERIYVTGQPRFDCVLQTEQAKEEVRRQLDLPDRFTVSVFTSAYDTNLRNRELQRQQEWFVNELGQQVNRAGADNILLLIKPHPRESLSNYVIPSDKNSARLVQDANSIDVIAASDIVISVPSTIIVEACLLEKPLFILNLGAGQAQNVSSHLGLPSWAFRELSIGKDSRQVLDLSSLEDLFSNDTQNLVSVCNDLVYIPEEGAAIQVAKLLAKLVA